MGNQIRTCLDRTCFECRRRLHVHKSAYDGCMVGFCAEQLLQVRRRDVGEHLQQRDLELSIGAVAEMLQDDLADEFKELGIAEWGIDC